MKKRANFYNILIIATLIFLIFSFHGQNLKADSGVTISPVSTEIKIKTEQNYKGSFNLTNNESVDLKFRFKEALLTDETYKLEDLSWFKIETPQRYLSKDSTVKIDYILNLPANVEPGIYSKLLITEFYTDSSEISINLALPLRINIVVESLFTEQNDLVIKDFDTQRKFIFDNKLNINIAVGKENSNVLVKPIGYLNIINPTGQIIYTKVLNESMQSLVQDLNYREEISLPVNGFSDIGQYTAQLLVTDSISGRSTLKKFTFVSVYQLYIVIFLIALIFGVLIIKFSKGLFSIFTTSTTHDPDGEIGKRKLLRKKSIK